MLRRRFRKYPYLIIGGIQGIFLFYTLRKTSNRKRSFIILSSYSGFAYLFEYIVVALLNGYVYKGGFIRQRELDNILGAVWSQLFYVPVTAMAITVLGLGWKAKLCFAFLFAMIEKLFIILGAFKNYWWKTRYTFILIFISFVFNDKWTAAFDKQNKFIIFATFFNMIQMTWMNIVFVFALLGQLKYGTGKILTWKEHFIIAPIHGVIVSLFAAWSLKVNRWSAKLALIVTMMMMDKLLLQKGMMKIKSWYVQSAIYTVFILAVSSYRKKIFKSD